MSYCIFCDIADGFASAQLPENRVIAQDRLVFAKPALGQFVEGYILIISREHLRAFGAMNSEGLAEVELFKQKLCQSLRRAYGADILVFEHGCGQSMTQRAGACIDHAHLHVLPLPLHVPLERALTRRFRTWKIGSLRDLATHEKANGPYIYLESKDKCLLFEVDVELPSQYMRRLICAEGGMADIWDWRDHPFRERISAFELPGGEAL
jgi:diadenosine tetraphosphate (Ap4A) HIT family hydrolase